VHYWEKFGQPDIYKTKLTIVLRNVTAIEGFRYGDEAWIFKREDTYILKKAQMILLLLPT
jgi:hypothetical protein